MTYGLLSYLVLGRVSAVVGYYFARKRTEHEVRYRHRVEVAEVFRMVDSARRGVRGGAGVRRAPALSESCLEEIERSVDGLKKYLAQQEMWLDRRSSAALETLS